MKERRVDNYSSFSMFKMIPIATKLVRRLDPPYDKKGKVTPVTGIKPITTDKFIITWTINWNVKPKARYLGNLSVCFKLIFKQEIKRMENKPITIKTPIMPNSSEIIEKIKSVWGSGK